MDINTIKDLITIFGFVVLLWNQNRTARKDAEEKTTNWLKVNMKLDAVCQSQTDIKDDIRELKKTSTATDKRLTVLEEQIKVVNHRLSDLEKET